jgi:hypothetical protein
MSHDMKSIEALLVLIMFLILLLPLLLMLLLMHFVYELFRFRTLFSLEALVCVILDNGFIYCLIML